MLAGADEDAEEELEIDLNDAEPEFLKVGGLLLDPAGCGFGLFIGGGKGGVEG